MATNHQFTQSAAQGNTQLCLVFADLVAFFPKQHPLPSEYLLNCTNKLWIFKIQSTPVRFLALHLFFPFFTCFYVIFFLNCRSCLHLNIALSWFVWFQSFVGRCLIWKKKKKRAHIRRFSFWPLMSVYTRFIFCCYIFYASLRSYFQQLFYFFRCSVLCFVGFL